MEINELTDKIIGAAIEFHRLKGPGLLESTDELYLHHELGLRGIRSERQVMLPITYKGLVVPEAYRIDLLIENTVMVELKTVEALKPIHTAQLLKDGLKRVVLNLPQ